GRRAGPRRARHRAGPFDHRGDQGALRLGPGHPVAIARGRCGLNALGARLGGRFEVDEWGYDDGLARAVDPLLGFVLRVEADGLDGLPADGPALLVANRRLGLAEPAVL